MPRIKFIDGLQTIFLNRSLKIIGIDNRTLSKMLNVSSRTIYDWQKEKFTLPKDSFEKIKTLTKEDTFEYSYIELPDRWQLPKAALQGGYARVKKYGPPGNAKGWSKGGKNSQLRRKENPEYYKNCNIAKDIIEPDENPELAELIGIILGDGGINTEAQVVITLNRKNDFAYAHYVKDLIEKLFELSVSLNTYTSLRRTNVIGVTISSVKAVKFFQKKGLIKGNKVKFQVDVPLWIQRDINLAKACLRGLLDTDGCVFRHTHHCKGKEYNNIGISFSNKSVPLLQFVKKTLRLLGFHPKSNFKYGYVALYREKEVIKYASEVVFKNTNHQNKIFKHMEGCVSG